MRVLVEKYWVGLVGLAVVISGCALQSASAESVEWPLAARYEVINFDHNGQVNERREHRFLGQGWQEWSDRVVEAEGEIRLPEGYEQRLEGGTLTKTGMPAYDEDGHLYASQEEEERTVDERIAPNAYFNLGHLLAWAGIEEGKASFEGATPTVSRAAQEAPVYKDELLWNSSKRTVECEQVLSEEGCAARASDGDVEVEYHLIWEQSGHVPVYFVELVGNVKTAEFRLLEVGND